MSRSIPDLICSTMATEPTTFTYKGHACSMHIEEEMDGSWWKNLELGVDGMRVDKFDLLDDDETGVIFESLDTIDGVESDEFKAVIARCIDLHLASLA